VAADFVAIDVETANADLASICQIGIARYANRQLVDEWKSYINPQDFFDGINISIHGIDESTVEGAPTLDQVASNLYQLLDGQIAVCHTHFDRVAIHQAFGRLGRHPPTCTWLDSARVARRAWKQFATSGYGLGNVCKTLGYEYAAHDALEDAKAAAHVLDAAIQETGLDVADWLRRVKQPIDPTNAGAAIARDGNPDGPLHGEILVFTGALCIPRREAADMAARVGCEVAPGVTRHTTLLVVGDQDITRLAGHEKSSKHRKAEALIAAGRPIRIVRETDFQRLVEMA
jgi:DNA polymerase III subunit epsilon